MNSRSDRDIILNNDDIDSRFTSMTAAQTAVAMAILTMGSKLLGFIRETVLAGFFGTSYVVDAYVMAQSIPSILFAGIFSSIAVAYMPMLAGIVGKDGEEEGSAFTSKVLTVIFFFAAAASAIGVIFSDGLTAIFARGFDAKTAEITSGFLKITFLYVFFSAASKVLESYLQYKNTFLPQIAAGYAFNISVIAAIIFSGIMGYKYLAVGLLLGHILQNLLIFIVAKRRDFRLSVSTEGMGSIVKQIFVVALPVFIGTYVGQLNVFVDKFLASGLAEGSVAALNYANILNQMVITLSVSILTTLLYPRIAKAVAAQDTVRLTALIQQGFNIIVMVAIPFALGAVLYCDQVVQIIYERGAFDPAATGFTASAYRCYSAGMVFMAINTFISYIFYSRKNTMTPMICAVASVIINIACSLALVTTLKHEGLAIATSIASLCNFVFLMIAVKIKCPDIAVIESRKKLGAILAAAVVSVAVSFALYTWIVSAVWMPRMVYLGIAVLVAAVVYLVLLKLMKIEELDIAKRMLLSR